MMEGEPWRAQLHSLIGQVTDHELMRGSLQSLSHLVLPSHDKQCCTTELCGPEYSSIQSYFYSGPYEELLYKLLHLLSNIELVAANDDLLTRLFVDGLADVSFEVLCVGVSEKFGLITNEKCVTILSKLISADKLSVIVTDRCSTDTQLFNGENESLIQAIVSIPDKAANRFQGNVPDDLRVESYYKLVYKAILGGLYEVKSRVDQGLPSSLLFISQLISKLCLHGRATELWDVLLANIMVRQDFLMSRIFHKVLTGIPLNGLESTIIPLLRCVHHYSDVAVLLGNTIIDTKKLQYLLMDKILLHKFYTGPDVHKLLYNVIGYLASSSTRVYLYQSIFDKLLSVWSDSSSIKCISFDQHFYISKAIVVCSAFADVPRPDKQASDNELVTKLMTGLQRHLSSSDPDMRHTGMAVAEIVSGSLNPNIETKLKFQYDSDILFSELKSMLTSPTVFGKYEYQSAVKIDEAPTTAGHHSEPANGMMDEDLDSDDDLEPIGEFEDKPRLLERAPAYLGDCMQGLLNEENPERVESCLRAASRLIRRSQAMTHEVSVEFAKILLHMGGALAIDDYIIHRHGGLVSLLVISPASVAEYLCMQFCGRNYNVRQRLDMLDALAAGALELSDPNAKDEGKTSNLVQDLGNVSLDDHSNEPSWRQIVDARIESNTRRFASASAPTEQGTANRFAPVAGHFFFPLLAAVRGDGGEYNPLTADSMLLVQYIYTLGKITASAQHCPIVSRMAAELLDVIWIFRCSGERAVRKAAIFCIAMALLVIPESDILSDNYNLADIREYLSDLIERDPDPEVKDMSVKVLSYLHTQLKKGLESKVNKRAS